MATPIIFKFVLNEMQDLVDAASVVASADDMADMKFSPEMFAIMADSYPALGGVIALHLWPQFFDEYVCNELLKSWTFVNNIFPLMIDMEESGFNSLTFTVTYPDSAELKFQAPNGLSNDVEFELIPSLDPLEVGDFDFSSFVSLESEEFVNIVTEYHMFDYVHVNVTSTRVTFSYAIMLETVLTQEDGECLIGGIRAPNQMEFIITLSPIEAFYSLAHRSKREPLRHEPSACPPWLNSMLAMGEPYKVNIGTSQAGDTYHSITLRPPLESQACDSLLGRSVINLDLDIHKRPIGLSTSSTLF